MRGIRHIANGILVLIGKDAHVADYPVNHDDNPEDLPSLRIPCVSEITHEVLERRQRTVERIGTLRKKIGPIGIVSDDLLHESRQEDEERVNGWFTDT